MARFDGLADNYHQNRPHYPQALIKRVVARLPATSPYRVVDIGAGTGFFAGLIALYARVSSGGGRGAIP